MAVYCFDTSSLIQAAHRAYPFANFVSLWQRFDDLITAERMIAAEAVLDDLERKSDQLFEWARRRRGTLVVPIDDAQQHAMTTIMADFEKLVESGKNRSGSDPWVIALAKVENAVVVTEEPRSGNKPKIPSVCDYYGIKCVRLLEVVQAENWVF